VVATSDCGRQAWRDCDSCTLLAQSRRAGQDVGESPSGSAVAAGDGSARADPTATRRAALVASPRGRTTELDNFRRRKWVPAIEASGVRKPARIYDLRSTFASNAIAAGVSVFELARVMGTSIEMIDHHYGTLLDGSASRISSKLAAFEAGQERPEERLGH